MRFAHADRRNRVKPPRLPPILAVMPSPDADYYVLLGLDPGADAMTIRNAWASEQRLWGVRQNAPDLATRHAAERHVQLLGEVKDVLLDPRRRANYDRERVARTASVLPLPLADIGRRGAVHQRGAARHAHIVKPLALGLAGTLITGSQILHWDVVLVLAVVLTALTLYCAASVLSRM
jgi:hypothetical protein